MQTRPPNQIRRLRVPTPLLVFKKLLPHEKLWDSGRGEEQTRREPRAATRIPGTLVRAITQSGDARVRAHFHDVMIFHARDRLPSMGKALGVEIASDSIEIHR